MSWQSLPSRGKALIHRLRFTDTYSQLRLKMSQQYQREGELLFQLSGADRMSEPEKDQHGHNGHTQ